MAKVDSGTSLLLRSRDVDLRQLVGGQALRALDLRNDLVAAALDAEAVDVVPAQQGGKVLAGLAQVNALRAELVAVEDDFGLRLVEFQIRVGVDEQAAGERLRCTSWLAKSMSCCGSAGEAITKSTGKSPPPGSGGGVSGITRMPAIFDSGPTDSTSKLLCCLLPLAPRLGHHAAETAGRRSDLKDALALGERVIDVVDLVREQLGLIDRRVGRGLNDSEDHSLVLCRRQLPLREHVERNDQQRPRSPRASDTTGRYCSVPASSAM